MASPAGGSPGASSSAGASGASVLGVAPSTSPIGGEVGKPLTVPLKVVQSPGGSTLALIPVTIEGQGPFAFALDTGASVSTIDSQLAQKLGLPNLGSAGQISGVAATAQAQQTEVKQWKIGNVSLPPAKIVSINLGGNNAQAGLAGLVGSDILSGYGAATLDYDQQVLILRPHVKQPLPSASAVSGTQTVPLKVVTGPSGSTLALIPVTIQGQGPFPFAVDTGASNSTIDTQLAQKLGLPDLGSAGQITGVAATTQAQQSEIKQWKIGSVTLPPTKVISVNLGGSNAAGGLAGLVGSDILSSFGAVTVDYDAQALILRPHIKRQLTGSASPSAAPAQS